MDSVLVRALIVFGLGSVLVAHLHLEIGTINVPSKQCLIESWCSVVMSQNSS